MGSQLQKPFGTGGNSAYVLPWSHSQGHNTGPDREDYRDLAAVDAPARGSVRSARPIGVRKSLHGGLVDSPEVLQLLAFTHSDTAGSQEWSPW